MIGWLVGALGLLLGLGCVGVVEERVGEGNVLALALVSFVNFRFASIVARFYVSCTRRLIDGKSRSYVSTVSQPR